MADIKVGHFTADGAIIYLPIGFIPSRFLLIDFHTDTNIKFYWWFSAMENDQSSGKQEGISVAEGVTANLADAGGITAYNTNSQTPTITTWSSAVSTAATARTATAPGTYIRPTTSALTVDGTDADRSLVAECVTAGTSSGTEPAWPVGIGDQFLDSDVRFEIVNVPEKRKGYQGVTIAAALMTDGHEMYFEAVRADQDINLGDVDSWVDGVYAD